MSRLDPKVAPTLVLPLTSAQEGCKLVLECSWSDSSRVTWHKDGNPLFASKDMAITQTRSRCSLVIHRASVEHSGEYTCQASNLHGKAATKCHVTVVSEGNKSKLASSTAVKLLSIDKKPEVDKKLEIDKNVKLSSIDKKPEVDKKLELDKNVKLSSIDKKPEVDKKLEIDKKVDTEKKVEGHHKPGSNAVQAPAQPSNGAILVDSDLEASRDSLTRISTNGVTPKQGVTPVSLSSKEGVAASFGNLPAGQTKFALPVKSTEEGLFKRTSHIASVKDRRAVFTEGNITSLPSKQASPINTRSAAEKQSSSVSLLSDRISEPSQTKVSLPLKGSEAIFPLEQKAPENAIQQAVQPKHSSPTQLGTLANGRNSTEVKPIPSLNQSQASTVGSSQSRQSTGDGCTASTNQSGSLEECVNNFETSYTNAGFNSDNSDSLHTALLGTSLLASVTTGSYYSLETISSDSTETINHSVSSLDTSDKVETSSFVSSAHSESSIYCDIITQTREPAVFEIIGRSFEYNSELCLEPSSQSAISSEIVHLDIDSSSALFYQLPEPRLSDTPSVGPSIAVLSSNSEHSSTLSVDVGIDTSNIFKIEDSRLICHNRDRDTQPSTFFVSNSVDNLKIPISIETNLSSIEELTLCKQVELIAEELQFEKLGCPDSLNQSDFPTPTSGIEPAVVMAEKNSSDSKEQSEDNNNVKETSQRSSVISVIPEMEETVGSQSVVTMRAKKPVFRHSLSATDAVSTHVKQTPRRNSSALAEKMKMFSSAGSPAPLEFGIHVTTTEDLETMRRKSKSMFISEEEKRKLRGTSLDSESFKVNMGTDQPNGDSQ